MKANTIKTDTDMKRIIKAICAAVFGAAAFYALWWALWVIQPLLGVPM